MVDPPESHFATHDSDDAIRAGMLIDGFRILRKLGQGGMGAVYLGRDQKLGRKVALKLLRPETMGSKEAVERFLFEARTTARFNHPHIVTIYAVGEHQERPYVALEFLEGQTLRERAQTDRLGLKGTLRVGLAIADALAEAHRHGILHRDLKPENVMIPRDGRLRVVDFGLAKRVAGVSLATSDPGTSGNAPVDATTQLPDNFQTGNDGVRGTPLYMAPEQWSSAPLTPATDVWSLGLMTYELLAGEHPCAGQDKLQICYRVCDTHEPMPPLVADVPPVLRDIIARCLVKDPLARPNLEEIREVFEYVLADDRPHLAEERSPFPGLLPLDERYSEQFFGRETETNAFLERMREVPVLPVVGPSGAGKSSFVLAGVVPRLREHGRWIVLRLRPGRSPIRALAARLLSGAESSRASSNRTPWSDSGASTAGDPASSSNLAGRDLDAAEAELADELATSPAALGLRLTEIAERERAWVLLFVDQLEELRTLCEDEVQRRTFMDALCLSADDADIPVRTVFTLRDDFLGRLAEGPVARDTLSRVTVLRTPGPEALGEILRGVAGSVRYTFDDETLVDRIVGDVRGEQAALPLIQFAGQALWRRRNRTKRLLQIDAYEDMGRVAGALALHTDEVLAGLPPPQLRLAKAILVRLVSPEGTRQVLPRSQLLDGLDPEADELADRLIRERVLLVRRGGASTDEPEVELVHESLIASWERLARWLEESRDELTFLHEVGQAASLWERRGRRPDELWREDALADALRRLLRCNSTPPDTVRDFLDAGQTRERAHIRRRNTLVAASFALLIALAVSLAMLALYAMDARKQAQEGEKEAQQRRAEALAEGAQSALLRGDLLDAGARVRESLELQDTLMGRALLWQVSGSQLRWTADLGVKLEDVDFSNDGHWVAAVGETGTVFLVDAITRKTRYLRSGDNLIVAVAFSPNSRKLATGNDLGEITVWDLEDDSAYRFPDHHRGSLIDLRFTPDGDHLASAGRNGLAHLWDTTSGAKVRSFHGHEHFVRAVAFSPAGDLMATGSNDRTAVLWDVETGEVLHVLEGHEAEVETVSIAPDGARIASGSADGTVRLWDATTGEPIAVLSGHEGPVEQVAFGSDGNILASAGHDMTVRLWDARTGSPIRTLRGHEGWITGLAFSPESRDLVSAGHDFTVRMWRDAADGARAGLPEARGHGAEVTDACFTPDGRSIVSSGWGDRSLRVWDRHSGEQRAVLTGHAAQLNTVACSPDGRLVATGGVARVVTLWDLDAGEVAGVLQGHDGMIRGLEFDARGSRLVSTSEDGTIAVWDVASQKLTGRLSGHEMGVGHAKFASDGNHIASAADDGTVRLWDASTGEVLWTVEQLGRPRSVEFAAQRGSCFAVDGHEVFEWDVDSGRGGSARHTDEPLLALRLHPHRPVLGVAGQNGFAALVELENLHGLELLVGHTGETRAIDFSPDGYYALTAGQDGTVRVWLAGDILPYWRTVALLASSREALTHIGWLDLARPSAEGEARAGAAVPGWRQALEANARLGVESRDGRYLCIHRPEQRHGRVGELVELWDTAEDERLASAPLADVDRIEAFDGGCLSLTWHGLVSLLDRAGGQTHLVDSGRAIRAADGEVLVATEDEVRVFDTDGGESRRYAVGTGVSALAQDGERWILGYEDGSIETATVEDGKMEEALVFDGTPGSEVVELLVVGEDALIAGFSNGTLGLWDMETGARLYRTQLHGPVRHLALADRNLYVATDLGDTEVLDLDALYLDDCELLQRVWEESRVMWIDGRAEDWPKLESPGCPP